MYASIYIHSKYENSILKYTSFINITYLPNTIRFDWNLNKNKLWNKENMWLDTQNFQNKGSLSHDPVVEIISPV